MRRVVALLPADIFWTEWDTKPLKDVFARVRFVQEMSNEILQPKRILKSTCVYEKTDTKTV